MKVLNEYPSTEKHEGHHYWAEYEETVYFCPNCGEQKVWAEQDGGDYYVGADFVCAGCGQDWTMQGPSSNVDANKLAILEQLRTGVTKTPTTRRGN